MTTPSKTDTAHKAWDEHWRTEKGRERWINAQEEVRKLIPTLQSRGVKKILDLGCGVGRHAIAYAASGFEVTGFDASDAGLNYAKGEAEQAEVHINFVAGEMTELPFEDGEFDFVLSWNVLYHGDAPIVSKAISEVHRVLKPNSFFQSTWLSKRSERFGQGKEIAPNTWVISDDTHDDKSHPHYYMNSNELLDMMKGYEVTLLELEDQSRPGGSIHWHCVAERL